MKIISRNLQEILKKIPNREMSGIILKMKYGNICFYIDGETCLCYSYQTRFNSGLFFVLKIRILDWRNRECVRRSH